MRTHRLAITAFSLATAGALGFSGAALAQSPAAAPPAPPAHAMPTPPPQAAPGPMHGPMAGMMHHWDHRRGGMMHHHWDHHWAGHHGWMAQEHAQHRFMHHVQTWALFHRPDDLDLSSSDVKTIAEGILLRHGEHDWKVGDVKANADHHMVSFAFLTEHGDVIARFMMNTETGRITRTG